MKRFLSTSLLLTLIYPVATLRCAHFIGKAANNEVKSEEEECNSEDASCFSIFVDIPFIGGDSVMVAKGCIPSSFCKAGNYIATIKRKFSATGRIDCCQGDLCNNISYPLKSQEEMPENGLTCPSCISIVSEKCKGVLETSCRGEEDRCFSIGGKSKVLGKLSARGCVTQNICDQLEAVLDLDLFSYLDNIAQFSCEPASGIDYDDDDNS